MPNRRYWDKSADSVVHNIKRTSVSIKFGRKLSWLAVSALTVHV